MKVFVNSLTVFRFMMTFFLPFLWGILNPLILLILIAFILLTDAIDGFLARHFKVQTLFGALADVFADKLFGIVIVILIAINYKEYYLIVVMELIISLINVVAGFLGATVKSSFLGKVKMWVLGITTFFGVVYVFKDQLSSISFLTNAINYLINFKSDIVFDLIFMTVGAELMVAIDYFRHIYKELKKEKKKLNYTYKKGDDLKYVLFDTDYYLKNKDKPMSKHLLV